MLYNLAGRNSLFFISKRMEGNQEGRWWEKEQKHTWLQDVWTVLEVQYLWTPYPSRCFLCWGQCEVCSERARRQTATGQKGSARCWPLVWWEQAAGAALSLSDWDWTKERWRTAGATLWTGQSGKPSTEPCRINYTYIRHLFNRSLFPVHLFVWTRVWRSIRVDI